jgi:hypothetical protein
VSDLLGLSWIDAPIRKDAEISACGIYRYRLTRRWDDPNRPEPLLSFVMLNPSDADASIDDPTIRRCMGFSRVRGFGGIAVGNLFAFRSPKPELMRAAKDPFGPLNGDALARIFIDAKRDIVPVVAAWGAGCHDADVAKRLTITAKGYGVPLYCLGTTKDGHPRHPLYVKSNQPLVEFTK